MFRAIPEETDTNIGNVSVCVYILLVFLVTCYMGVLSCWLFRGSHLVGGGCEYGISD